MREARRCCGAQAAPLAACHAAPAARRSRVWQARVGGAPRRARCALSGHHNRNPCGRGAAGARSATRACTRTWAAHPAGATTWRAWRTRSCSCSTAACPGRASRRGAACPQPYPPGAWRARAAGAQCRRWPPALRRGPDASPPPPGTGARLHARQKCVQTAAAARVAGGARLRAAARPQGRGRCPGARRRGARAAAAQGENKGFMVCKTKMGTSAEQLCRAVSEPFRRFTDAVIALAFEEEPAYGALRSLFEPLLGAGASRPITVDVGAAPTKARPAPPAYERERRRAGAPRVGRRERGRRRPPVRGGAGRQALPARHRPCTAAAAPVLGPATKLGATLDPRPNPEPRRRRAGGPEARARGAGGAGRGPGRRAAQEGARGLRRAAVDYCLQQARPHEAAARPPRPPTPPLPGPAASPAGAPDRHASPPFRVGTIAGGIRCSRGPPRRRGGRRQGAPPRQPPRGRREGPPAARARAVTTAARAERRYHYNVATCRLDVHVTKGRADGLHVSSVGAAGELWAVIMDAGTQFTAQARPPGRPGAGAAAAGAAGVRLGGLRQAGELRARAAPCVAAPGGAEGSGGCAAARRVPLHCQAAVQPESARGALSARPRARRRCTAWRNASSCPRTGSWSSGTPGTTSPPSPVRRAPRSSPPPAGSPAGRLTCRASAPALALRCPGLDSNLQGITCAEAR